MIYVLMCDIYFELIFEREKKEKSVKGQKVVKKKGCQNNIKIISERIVNKYVLLGGTTFE